MKASIWKTTLGRLLIGICVYLAVVGGISLVVGGIQLIFPGSGHLIADFGVLMEVGTITGIIPALIIAALLLVVVIKGLTGSESEKAAFAEGWKHKEPLIRAPYIIAFAVFIIVIFTYISIALR